MDRTEGSPESKVGGGDDVDADLSGGTSLTGCERGSTWSWDWSVGLEDVFITIYGWTSSISSIDFISKIFVFAWGIWGAYIQVSFWKLTCHILRTLLLSPRFTTSFVFI